MTAAEVDTDLTIIESLEFQPPCEIEWRTTATGQIRPCANAAEWIVTYQHHCLPDVIRTRLLCAGCLADYMSPARAAECTDCGGLGDPSTRIISTERITS